MQGKRSEYADWIMDYLRSQGENTSNWESYHTIYLRYVGRVKKFHPENYEQFVATCTFPKKTKKECKTKDLEEPKEKPFDEEKWWKSQKKDWELWKKRMQHYRDSRIHNQQQQGETGRIKDMIPYTFRFALRCLAGIYPEEIFPKELEEFREELQNLLEMEKVWTTLQ